MVDHEPRNLAQPRVRRVAVDLEVPAGELVDAPREPDEVEIGAAVQVRAAGAHAGRVAAPATSSSVMSSGTLRDADEAVAEPLQRVDQVRLVERLEGAGDDRAAGDVEPATRAR